jgi:signal transduction histidine kinase
MPPSCLHLLVAASLWLLANACATAADAAAPKARPIGDLLALTSDAIAARPLVRIEGIVTVAQPLLVQDDTGAIFVNDLAVWSKGQPVAAIRALGARVGVTGRLTPGGFVPMVLADAIDVLGSGELPPADPIELGTLFGGAATGRRIAIDGIVQGSRDDAATWVLVVESAARRLFIDLPKDVFPDDPGTLVDARIHCAGSVLAVRNTRGDFLGPVVRVVRREDLAVLEPAPSTAFEAPLVPLEAIARYRSPALNGRRFRTAGTVTCRVPGEFLCLQSGLNGIRVSTLDTQPLAVGDEVEVAGFLDSSADVGRVVEAVVRRTGSGPSLEPLPISPADILRVNGEAVARGAMATPSSYEGCLIEFPARLVDQQVHADGGWMTLAAGETNVDVTFVGPGFESLARLEPGSRIDVTGVVKLDFTESRSGQLARRQPSVERLGVLIREPGDVRLVEPPPWWTPRRLLAAVAASLAAVVASLAWIWSLRREVAIQSSRAADEAAARREAAVDYEITLRERNRLAANLHDTILQTVTGIGYQLKACLRTTGDGSADALDGTAKHLDVARKMVDHAAEQLRGTVWSLRSLPLEGGTFHDSLQALVERVGAGHPAGITIEYRGPHPDLPDYVVGNLILVIQEAVHNALHHGDPRTVRIIVGHEPAGPAIEVEIGDDGCGFTPGAQRGPTQGHFGLEGMRERVQRIGGRLSVESTPGAGTVVRATIPRIGANSPPSQVTVS